MRDIKLLLEGCINKDEAAWSRFVNHFSGLIAWAIRDRLTRWRFSYGHHDIEDIKQQLLAEVWEKNRLAELRCKEKIVPWLAIVAGNFTVNYMRKRYRAHEPSLQSIFDETVNIDAFKDSHNPYSALATNELTAFVQDYIDNLPELQRTVLVLNYFYGKKHREIAATLQLPINTVSTLIKRAKDSLKQKLQDKGF
jgi:RNA polymerase sigma-70 factor (ECF subfamily)